MILQSFAVYLISLIAGFALIHLIWKTEGPWAFLLKILLGASLGLGITSGLYFLRLLIWPGQNGYLPIQVAFLFLVCIALYQTARLSIPKAWRWPSMGPWQIFLGVVALAVLGVSIYYVLIFARITPHGDYDAQAIWNLRARFIYRLGDEWRNSFSPLVNRNFHLDYPILVPLTVVGGWHVLGGEVLRVPAVLSMIFLFGMAGVIFSALAYLRSPAQGLIGFILLLSTPLILRYSTFQTADIALASFMLSSTVLFVFAHREQQPGLYILSGMTAALAAWTKNEGLPFLLIVLAVTYLSNVRQMGTRSALMLLTGALFPLLIIVLFKSLFGANNDIFADNGVSALIAKLLDPTRYVQIFTRLITELFQLGDWPFSIILVLIFYGLVVGKSKRQIPAEKWVVLMPLFQLGVYILIYLITPHDLEWHLNYSMSRLLIQIFPMTLFAFLLSINTPEDIVASAN